ncbi:DUF4837 family protein [Flavobacterium sp. 3HN19-14]|uniref:DUF4837 family protein n=1 Tax=Flavobacterium sp. 3HN19-14 TaxID=3448133 RepID=UPI003EE19315
MKKTLLLVFSLVLLFNSCKDIPEKVVIVPSSGKINNISLIISDQLWNGEVGDSIRKKFAAPVDGLPQEEPLFTINQYPVRFQNDARNIIIIRKEEKNSYKLKENEFAEPQNVVHISGKNVSEILAHIETHADEIIKKFKATEISESQKNIDISLLDDKKIRKKFGISMHLPSTYKYALLKPGFIWMKREILSGNNSILIYKVPFRTILKNNDMTGNIIKMRDSIGALYIHSKVRNTKMITEESYAPYFFTTKLDGKRAYETKGTWELKGDFMSGSFVNYAIMDRKKRNFIIIEGFCYAPSTEKRDLMHEMEAIIKSTKSLQ